MKKIFLIFLIFALSGFVSAQVVSSDNGFFGSRTGTASFVNYGSSFSSYYGSNADTYWPILSNRDSCVANQDIIVQISPAGCQPAVVRSDLLAEQNVPVFCQLDMLQVNPAIDVKQIRNIRFSGNYPEYVAGVGFHPANAALRTTNSLLGTPLESNIGYVVVVLKRNPNENSIPEFFNFTLSASIDYYSGNAVGIGATELLLKETNDQDWEVAKNKQTLFNGRMSVRVKDTDSNNSISVELYSGDVKYSELTLQKGQSQSNSVYLPGSYCQTALQFSYTDFVAPSAIARVQVDNDVLDLYQGSRFLNNKCVVRSINNESYVDINCGSNNFRLSSFIQVLNVNDKVYLLDNKTLQPLTGIEYTINKVVKKGDDYYYDIGLGEGKEVSYRNIRPVSNNVDLVDKSHGDYDQYFEQALTDYQTIVNDFGNEKKDLGNTFGEVALTQAIDFAILAEKKKTALDLINKYIENYPNGLNYDRFVRELNDFYLRKDSSSVQNVQMEDGYHTIRLLYTYGAGKKSSARISWGNQQNELFQGNNTEFNGLGRLNLLRVLNSERIEIETVCSGRDNTKQTLQVGLGDSSVSACGGTIRVSNIDFQDFVKLRISPVTRTGSITNFTVGIGIEKRAIELTPSKANKKIENLNKSIQKWESISNKLGEAVTGLKAACFATAGVLTVKNFFTGLSGEALARRNVMSGEDGWTKFCQNEVNSGNYESLTQCYNANSANIASDVNARKNAITSTNALTEQIENSNKYQNRDGTFSAQSFNESAAKIELINRIKSTCSNEVNNVGIRLPSTVNAETVAPYQYSQLRDIYYNCQTLKNGGSVRGNSVANLELSRINSSISERLKYESDLQTIQVASAGTGLAGRPADVQGEHRSLTGKYYGGTLNDGDFGLTGYSGRPAQITYYNSEKYLAVLKDESGTLVADKMFKFNDDGTVNTADVESVKSKYASFEKRDPTSYNNQFAPGETTVRYYETEPYKGLPAIVPFDFNRGFYVATTQALPIFGGTKSFEDNGNPSSFFVCNVMSGGRIDFYAPNYGNDECVQFNYYTGQSYSNFPGLSEQDTRNVVTSAVRALKDAAQQYGKSSVSINGQTINVGRSASLLPGSQCQDFMSPEECKILFNVCDPVICPTSRCNFGGEYYVSDVIQSGIVGSALLCLPNIKEEIYVPVCLTGIKAGIDGYLSILKSHQQCLQEAVDTGRYVGICDQISSVYLCEFFWRQAAPLAKTALPKLVEYAYTGGSGNVRGGGEYLTVQSSWQNAQDSVNYFTQSYAVNSFDAFNVRSIEEAGTELCRAFISAKGPSSFETLIEPDSPPQFHAWYSSIDYTDATVPATAQYKVFYHIFAGNDRGVSYSVYLKDPPSNTQYANNPIVSVATGFVARGQYATESKDFTAPKGYQQLCVRINDKEECGFKQVSSSFAVNYVSDKIVSEELTRTDITSESECISGSVNPASLLNPNIQSVGEEALNPAIYNRGIVRICATSNPGLGTDETRFVNVGNCGSERLVCWLDKKSLDKAVSDSNVGIQDKTLSEIEQIQINNFNEDNRFIGEAQLKSELDNATRNIGQVTSVNVGSFVSKLTDILNKAFWGRDKAEVLLFRANAYKNAFSNSIPKTDATGVLPQSAYERTTVPLPPSEAGISGGTSQNTILKFQTNYDSNGVTNITLGNEVVLYLDRTRLYSFEGKALVGFVLSNGDIRFGVEEQYIERVNGIFGDGSYNLLNNKINVNQLQQGIDLRELIGPSFGIVEPTDF